jgi:hypothetical protein
MCMSLSWKLRKFTTIKIFIPIEKFQRHQINLHKIQTKVK